MQGRTFTVSFLLSTLIHNKTVESLQGGGRSRTRGDAFARRRQSSLGTWHPLLEPQDV